MPGNLQSIPASVIANWPPPNYIDPVRRTWMPAFAGTFQAVATLLLVTRLCLRANGKAGKFGLDDVSQQASMIVKYVADGLRALLIPAYLGSTAFTTLCILGAQKHGMDRHIWDVRYETFEYTALIGWAAQVAFIISTCSTKISVLLFYRRLTEGSCRKLWKYLTIGAIIFTAAYCIALVLALVFNCSPTSAYWRSFNVNYVDDYRCADTTVLNPLSGALSILSDVYSVVLPMLIMARLQATQRQKWALNLVFSLGLLVVAAGIARTYYLERLGTHWDITWLGFDVLVWSQVEIQLSIICACAPALRVLFRSYLSNSLSKAIGSAKTSSSKNANRLSRPSDTICIVSYPADSSTPQEHGTAEECGLDKTARSTLESVADMEAASATGRPSTASSLVRTPREYESFVLDNLREQHKQYIVWASAPRS
ncbi:hypothetical protein Slin14017_G017620 [Septoria linicola]|nr:hypothetical protein Slin14017_G017620 [Septoria linicola]